MGPSFPISVSDTVGICVKEDKNATGHDCAIQARGRLGHSMAKPSEAGSQQQEDVPAFHYCPDRDDILIPLKPEFITAKHQGFAMVHDS